MGPDIVYGIIPLTDWLPRPFWEDLPLPVLGVLCVSAAQNLTIPRDHPHRRLPAPRAIISPLDHANSVGPLQSAGVSVPGGLLTL